MSNNNKKGFSLIELLVVLAIMTIMGAIVVPKYASNKNAQAMKYAKTQIVNDIRYVQTYTLNTKKFPDGSPSPIGGYGIHFQKDKDYYTVFGDKRHAVDPNYLYDDSYPAGSADYEFYEQIDLVDGVHISKLTVNGTEVDSVDYVSTPPYGKIFIAELNTNVELEITYMNSADDTGVVKANSSGLIIN
ncbi:MAG: type II secretion system protein [Candidatus Pacebacteria bacterium]|nr:type II secretion system protein [Candidatus Paceibacterota bacterium]